MFGGVGDDWEYLGGFGGCLGAYGGGLRDVWGYLGDIRGWLRVSGY